MEYTTLTGTGLQVSRVCMGTMTFGGQADEAAGIEMVNHCLEAGVNFFDTANAYTEGRSEIITGKALRDRRQEVILASKVCNKVGPGINDGGLSRKHILEALDASLRRLETDYLDIYYMHMPDHRTPFEETLATMDQLVRSGRVRYVGVSNFASWQICQQHALCDTHNWSPPVVAQQIYNLLARGIEQENTAFLQQFGIGLVVYNPLAGGLLTGKYSGPDDTQSGTRFSDGSPMFPRMRELYRDRYWQEEDFTAVAALKKIAQQAGKSLVELSLQWLLGRPPVDCVILGASRLEQLQQNLSALEGTIDDPTSTACDEVYRKLRGPVPIYNR